MCGIVGVYGHPEAANITYLGLHALQHRGQEAAGIVTSDGDRFHQWKEQGLVADAFSRGGIEQLPRPPARGPAPHSPTRPLAIGHVRYSTTGGSGLRNAQPFAVEYAHGSIGVAHNGNLVNAADLRR